MRNQRETNTNGERDRERKDHSHKPTMELIKIQSSKGTFPLQVCGLVSFLLLPHPAMGERLLSLHCCPQVNDPPQDPASLLPVPPCPHHLLLCSPGHTLYNKITELVTPSFPNTEVTLLIAASAFKFLLIFNYQCRKLAGLSQDEFWF